ncbi:MAG: pyridoxal 5'-phosphate synthase glutaminase subunit PdxT, partial [Candidatus Eisenbacteria bacterium]|nr:pyridoxal 5'-phosphate synthase glutaminase subunit PdxT [Candidatus Eisenbacteria bacterium]
MKENGKPAIGLLALQGAFHAHGEVLARLGAEIREVRLPRELNGAEGLVLPGGESTTLLRLIEEYGFDKTIPLFASEGKPILATCMGLILLAREVTNPAQRSLGLLDVAVERNAYGRQVDSFEAEGEVLGRPFPMVFIRAPRILDVGKNVEVLGTLRGEPVLVRQRNILAAAFHPELT